MRYTTIIDKNGRMVNNAAKKENSFPKNYHGCYLLMLIAMLGSLIFGAVASLNLI